jgi:hypothetical protein
LFSVGSLVGSLADALPSPANFSRTSSYSISSVDGDQAGDGSNHSQKGTMSDFKLTVKPMEEK